MSKLWIIGDSFANIGSDYNIFWTDILTKKFNGKVSYISTAGSRDPQTILDIFLRYLQFIEKDDLVIMVIPTSARCRLPLLNPKKDICLENETESIIKYDYFIGEHQYNSSKEDRKLEKPLTNLHDEFFTDKNIGLTDKLWLVVNSSNAFKNNFIEILKSLKNVVQFNFFIWSWTDEWDDDLIISKSKIKDELGFWHTCDDLWYETNGADGIKEDHHFSHKMHAAFADYLIVKFPQFFNI